MCTGLLEFSNSVISSFSWFVKTAEEENIFEHLVFSNGCDVSALVRQVHDTES